MKTVCTILTAILLCGLYSVHANGQEKKDETYVIVEDMPEFPGGEEALRKYISEHVNYPEIAKKNGIQGKVYVSFQVSKDGSVKDARVARGVDPSLDKEALRVIKNMPKWKPGKQRGEPVNVAYTLPIQFKLDDDNAEKGDKKSKITHEDQEGKPVFYIVEDMPEFPGGENALREYISNHVKYPEIAKKNGIQGKVFISFVVSKDGSVTDAKVARGVDPSLDKEALRVIKSLPDFKPGKQRGELVSVSYTVPVNFVLDTSKQKKEN